MLEATCVLRKAGLYKTKASHSGDTMQQLEEQVVHWALTWKDFLVT